MDDFNQQKPRDVDMMWPVVQRYYEKMYSAQGFKFKDRPSDHQVRWFYEQMQKLEASIEKHVNRKKPKLELLN